PAAASGESTPAGAAIKPVRDPQVVPATATSAFAAKEIALPVSVVKPENGKVTLHVALVLPPGWKINPIGPMAYQLESKQEKGPIDRAAFGKKKLDKPVAEFDVPLSIKGEGEDSVTATVKYYYCEDKEGDDATCKIGTVVFAVPLKVSAEGKT